MMTAHLTERFGIYGFQANIFIITIIKTTVDHFYSSYLFFFFFPIS